MLSNSARARAHNNRIFPYVTTGNQRFLANFQQMLSGPFDVCQASIASADSPPSCPIENKPSQTGGLMPVRNIQSTFEVNVE